MRSSFEIEVLRLEEQLKQVDAGLEGTRDASADLTASPDGRTFEGRVTTYNVPDTYRTSWAPGYANEGLRQGLPTLCWGHDKKRVIGKATKWWEGEDGLYMRFRLADPEAVPDARMAQSLVKDGMITGLSIGFGDAAGRPDPTHRGVTQISRARVHEVSLVVTPSVPGARVLAVRSAAPSGRPRTVRRPAPSRRRFFIN